MTAPVFRSESTNERPINQRWETKPDGLNNLQTRKAPAFPDGKLVLSVTETAELLGIGRSAAYEACRTNQIPNRRVGRRILVPVPQLLAWLNGTDK